MAKKEFTFVPVGFDLFAPHAGTPEKGARVRKTQPFGCPKNGTMGHCYVEDAETGEFYGLVMVNSLVPFKRCATIGCKAGSTEEVSYEFRGEPATELVCESCADSYQRRPALAGFTRKAR